MVEVLAFVLGCVCGRALCKWVAQKFLTAMATLFDV